MEHYGSYEVRHWTTETPTGETEDVEQFRYVCTCGRMTRWHRSLIAVRRQQTDHALDGQMSFE